VILAHLPSSPTRPLPKKHRRPLAAHRDKKVLSSLNKKLQTI
jgi:hypothetical protein